MRSYTHRLTAVSALCALLACAPGARADNIDWLNPNGGDYHTPANWSTQSVPTSLDDALFDLSTLGYTVTLSNFATLSDLLVGDDNVTLELSGFQLSVNGTFQLTTAPLQTADVTVKNDTLFVAGAGGVVIGSPNSVANLTLTGTTTRLFPVDIHVGGNAPDSITGTLIIENEAVAQTTSGHVFIGRFDGNDGTVIVRDPDSGLLFKGRMEIATGGSGLLEVLDSGRVLQRNAEPWIIGPGGIVNVTAGGFVQSGGWQTPGGTTTIGSAPGATANVTVSGLNSTWELFGPTSIGELGPTLLNINAGGFVEQRNPEPFIVGPLGTVSISRGATLITEGPASLGAPGGGTALMTIGDGSRWDSFGPTLEIGVDGPATLSLDAGAVMRRDPTPYIVGPEGLIEGLGTLVGDPQNNGEFFPGFGFGEVGTLTVDGNYTQLAGGTLRLELDGTGPGEFGVLAVTGTATLGGTLNIQTTFAPALGDSFGALSYSDHVGEFAIVSGLDLGGVTSYGLDFAEGLLTLEVDETVGLTVSPAGVNPIQIEVGESVQLAARTLLARGGGANASADSEWSSSNDAIASVSALGLVSGAAEGVASISASFQGFGDAVSVTVGVCPANLDDDGMVRAFDLAILLGNWGPSPPGAPDFDGDGDVDASDLAFLLRNWGPCP